MSFTFNTFYFIYKILYTDIVPPQKTKTVRTPDHLKVKTVSVLTKLSLPSPSYPLHYPHLNYTTPHPKIVEQIVNILPPTSLSISLSISQPTTIILVTPFMQQPSAQITIFFQPRLAKSKLVKLRLYSFRMLFAQI